jgi:hypothetical protein
MTVTLFFILSTPNIQLDKELLGVRMSMLALIVVIVGSNQTIKLTYAASLLNTQREKVRAKTGWLRIRIICPSGATCLTHRLLFQ